MVYNKQASKRYYNTHKKKDVDCSELVAKCDAKWKVKYEDLVDDAIDSRVDVLYYRNMIDVVEQEYVTVYRKLRLARAALRYQQSLMNS